MKKEAEKLFDDNILRNGAKLFGVELDTLKQLAGFENLIYGGRQGTREVILRYGHTSHRDSADVAAELDWLAYLKRRGATVCGPIPSLAGNLVETIPAGETEFVICAVEKAQGKPMKPLEEGGDGFFYHWGRTTAQLHRLTREYSPSEGIQKRGDYLERSRVFDQFLLDGRERAFFQEIVQQVESLPRTSENYLLCHTDLHHGNFHYDGTNLWIFDFDDCAYHYRVHDLAMPLYYVTWRHPGSESEKLEFAARFFKSYLAGYLSEESITLQELQYVDLFLRLRDGELCGLLRHELGPNLSQAQQKLLSGISDRLVSKKPVVTLDYADIFGQI